MIQINLLPDVKLKYIKSRRTKHMVVMVSVIISASALLALLLLITVAYGTQRFTLNNLETSITDSKNNLQKIDGLDKILTVQNQLGQLTQLHSQKPVMTRLIPYVVQITPADVQIADLSLDVEKQTVTVSGSAKSIEAVNKFVDTLKFTDYKIDEAGEGARAFSSVVLSSVSVDPQKGASYSLSFIYQPAILDSQNKSVSLIVPNIVSTRSETERPTALFNGQAGGAQ